MAATVAHEIKNPLSAIKSIAQVMREDKDLSKNYARDLSLIVRESDRLSQSLTQLLSFARKESPPELPLRTGELVTSVVNLFKASAEEQRINIECEIHTNPELAGGAVSAVRDSLSNLLLNALQATPGGGEISVCAQMAGNTLSLIVADSGPGVSDELQHRIWEPFFTTKQRGTGLGLAIVRKRMEEAGGTAHLTPGMNGKGARFELRLPLQEPLHAID
jgi:signal transduction histidine kinase